MDAGWNPRRYLYSEGNIIRFILKELPVQMTGSVTFDPATLRIGLKPTKILHYLNLRMTNLSSGSERFRKKERDGVMEQTVLSGLSSPNRNYDTQLCLNC